MPDYDRIIEENAVPIIEYDSSITYIQDQNIINESIKVNGSIT
jgi:hypothetical protein